MTGGHKAALKHKRENTRRPLMYVCIGFSDVDLAFNGTNHWTSIHLRWRGMRSLSKFNQRLTAVRERNSTARICP